MKKCLAAGIILTMGLWSMNVFAAEGISAKVSDIRAFIDYTPIESYQINDYTYIPVDRLTSYGFDVAYDNEAHRIDVSRRTFATPVYNREMWDDSASIQTDVDIVGSNMQVFLDGQSATSLAIPGRTLLLFDELQKYGTVTWEMYSRKISVTIFKEEMQREFDTADGIVQTEFKTNEGVDANKTASYTGQVNEENQPDGIGIAELKNGMTSIKYLGYFSNGKPNGLIYKETRHHVLKSYVTREIRFIGKVDGSREAYREYTDRNVYPVILLRGSNFGAAVLPKTEIPEWTGPEVMPDRTIYTEGCYFENCYGKSGTTEYRIWNDGSPLQTVLYLDFGNSPMNGYSDYINENSNAWYITDFYEYINEKKVSYDGFLHTLSRGAADGEGMIRNSPADGAEYIAVDISVFANGEKLDLNTLPVMENDRVLVPVRNIAESLGAQVEWNEALQQITITRGSDRIVMQIGARTMQINDRTVALDVASILKYGRTLVPVRAVAEMFGAAVGWNEAVKEVTIQLD